MFYYRNIGINFMFLFDIQSIFIDSDFRFFCQYIKYINRFCYEFFRYLQNYESFFKLK